MTIMIALMLAVQLPPPPVPIDWAVLPPMPWRELPQITPDLNKAAALEAQTGGCTLARPGVELDLAVLVRGDGTVRSVVPRAIDCAMLEQFAVGLVTSFARNNLRAPAAGWYRASLAFAWGP